MPGAASATGLKELAKLHFDHECIPFKQVCGTGQKQISFDKVALVRRPNMPPRTPTSASGCGCG